MLDLLAQPDNSRQSEQTSVSRLQNTKHHVSLATVMQTDQSKSEAVVSCPWRRIPHHLKPLRSNPELVVRQSSLPYNWPSHSRLGSLELVL
jgi:hypothetical protein